MAFAWPGMQSFGPVHFVPGEHGARYPEGNLVFVDAGLPVVLDPITRPASAALAAQLDVKLLFNSHCHEDHRAGNDLFPSADLWVPERERCGYDGPEALATMWEVPAEEAASWGPGWMARFPGMARTDVAGAYAFGDTFTWGDVPVEVVPIPGHSPGQSGFFFPEQRVIFIADVDLTKFGPWYAMPTSDIDAFLETIDVLLEYVDRVDALLTSHERGAVRGDLRRELEAYRAIIHARDHRLLAYLKAGPRTWNEILQQEIVYFYPSKTRRGVQGDDQAMIAKHVQRLVSSGIVHQDGERYVLAASRAAERAGG